MKRKTLFGITILSGIIFLASCKNRAPETTTEPFLSVTDEDTSTKTLTIEDTTTSETIAEETETKETTTEESSEITTTEEPETSSDKEDITGISFKDITVSYDGLSHSLSIEGTLPEGVTVSYSGNDKTDAGTYTVTASFSDTTGKYNVPSDMEATLTISKAVYDMSAVSFLDTVIYYDGTEHSISIDGTLPEGVTVAYSGNENMELGTYTVTAAFTGDSNHEDISDMKATLTIMNDPKKAGIIHSELLTIDGLNCTMSLSNETASISFKDDIEVSPEASWILTKEKEDTKDLKDTDLSLETGDNTFYITVTSKDKTVSNCYLVTVRRKPLYKVTYNTDGGTPIDEEIIEEDSSIELKSSSKTGYVFSHYEVDDEEVVFPYTVTSDVTLTAVFTPASDTKYMVEYYLENLDGTFNDEADFKEEYRGTTDSLTEVIAKDYPGFTNEAFEQVNISPLGTSVINIKYLRNTYTLSLSEESKYGGSTKGLGIYKYGEIVTLSATPYLGYDFNGFDDTYDLSVNYTVTEDKEFTLYSVKDEMSNFKFESNFESCKITGVLSTKVKEIYVPIYITSIECGAFKAFKDEEIETGETGMLETITLPFIGSGDGTASYFEYIFGGIDSSNCIYEPASLNKVVLEKGITEILQVAFSTSLGLFDLVVPEGIESFTFAQSLCLKSVVLPDGIETIVAHAFNDCQNLESVNIPDSVTSIGNSAFFRCKSLSSIVIPTSVISIGRGIFQECTSLETITIPYIGSSVTDYQQLWYLYSPNSSGSNTTYPCGVRNIILEEGCIGIHNTAFMDYNYLEYLYVPASLKTGIICSTFHHCFILKGIEVAESNPVYDSRDNCKALIQTSTNTLIAGGSESTIPDTVTTIDVMAFNYRKNLESIVIPSGVTSIGQYAFAFCTSLKTVKFEDGFAKFKNVVFANCTALEEIYISSTLTSDIKAGFQNCTNIRKLIVSESNSVYDSRDNCNAIIETKTNTLYWGGADSTIPESVSVIGNAAFSQCESLSSIIIPKGVTTINPGAFNSCKNLVSVSISNTVSSIGDNAFSKCTSLKTLSIPESVESIGSGITSGCTSLVKITATGNSIYEILSNCIVEKETMTLVAACASSSISSNVKIIGSSAFASFNNYKSITIPTSVTSIGDSAFSDCYGLKSITIPTSVTSIGNSAFSGCYGLTSVTIPSTVTSLGTSAFSYCDMTSATISLTGTIGKSAFYECSNLTKVTISSSVTGIGDSAFYGCSDLTSITIPTSVTSIGKSAFSYCTGLTSVTIPTSITSIGENVFYNCSKLASVTIPTSVESIGESAFSKCSSLTSITIPTSVTSIGKSAFSYCTGLTSVTIPSSVTSIGADAFYNCTNLTYNVYGNGYYLGNTENPYLWLVKISSKSITSCEIHEDCVGIANGAFNSCTNLASVTMHYNIAFIGASAFSFCSSLTSISYDGSEDEWNAISFGTNWNYNTGAYIIECRDADISKS